MHNLKGPVDTKRQLVRSVLECAVPNVRVKSHALVGGRIRGHAKFEADLCRVAAGKKPDLGLRCGHFNEGIRLSLREPHPELARVGKVIDERRRYRHYIAGGNVAVAIVVRPAPALYTHRRQGRRLNCLQRIHKPPPKLSGQIRVLRVHVVARQPNVLPQRVRCKVGKPRFHQCRNAGYQRRRKRRPAYGHIVIAGSGGQDILAWSKNVHQPPVIGNPR